MGLSRSIVALLCGGLLTALTLSAGTIGGVNGGCLNNSCLGGVYTLNGWQIGTVGANQLWQYQYTIDTSGYSGTTNDVSYVGKLAAKVTSNVVSAFAVSGPTGGTWTLSENRQSTANGCDGSGSGWVCLLYGGGAAINAPGGVYTWVFNVTMAPGTALTTASIQADYDPKIGVRMSENIRVPEGVAFELPLVLSALGIWFGRKYVSRRRTAA